MDVAEVMSDRRKFLILFVTVIAFALVGRVAWNLFAPSLTETVGLFVSLIGAAPKWLWWAVFGIAMSMICPLRMAFCGRRCRTA